MAEFIELHKKSLVDEKTFAVLQNVNGISEICAKTRRICSKCRWDVPEYGKLYSYCPNCGAKMDGGVNDEKLDAAPTVDAVEVVRCKDCEYSYDDISSLCCSHGVCADCEVPPNFYCAEGKRKENE